VFTNTCKTLLFTFMSVLHVRDCSGALLSNCRQPQSCTALVKATQQLFGLYLALMYKQ
jgi:hypothetical protein